MIFDDDYDYVHYDEYEQMDYDIQNTPNLFLLLICNLSGPRLSVRDIKHNYELDEVKYAYVELYRIHDKRIQYREKYLDFRMGTAVLFKNGKVVGTVENHDPVEVKSLIDKNR